MLIIKHEMNSDLLISNGFGQVGPGEGLGLPELTTFCCLTGIGLTTLFNALN